VTEIIVSGTFSAELYGEVHAPYGEFELELCAALFGEGEPTPFAFTTSSLSPSAVSCITFRERQGKYITADITPSRIDDACAQLIIAAHSATIDDVQRRARGTINPTLKHLTMSARELGFGLSATFIDEDSVYGAQLLVLTRTEQGWRLRGGWLQPRTLLYDLLHTNEPFDFSPLISYNITDMKSSIHPQDYRPVVFSDEIAGFAFLTQSTAQTTETIKWEDGNEYPLVKVHISSASHPFFTGEEKIIDTEGRVDRFASRLKAAEERKAALASKAKKAAAKKAAKADN